MDDATPVQGDGSGLQRMLAWLRGERVPSGFTALLGMAPVSAVLGDVLFAVTPTADHYNPGGSVHGGFTATLLDTAMGFAAHTVMSQGERVTTLELKVSYHRAITVATGRLDAQGRVLSRGRRTVFAEGQVRDGGGRLLASASSTLLVIPAAV